MGHDDNHSSLAAVGAPQKARVPLWRMTKDSRTAEASLLLCDNGAVEVQLFADGDIFRGRRCASRKLAQQYAAKLLDEYRRRGWTAQDGEGIKPVV